MLKIAYGRGLGKVLLFSLLVLAVILIKIEGVFGSIETRDMLYGDGAVETLAQYEGFAYTAGVGTLAWDSTSGANGTAASIKGNVARTNNQSPPDTFFIDHNLLVPEGLTSASVSFWYKLTGTATTLENTTIKAQIIDPQTLTVVWTSTVYNATALSPSWIKTNTLNIDTASLTQGKSYIFRIEAYLKPQNWKNNTINLDEIVLNMSWNDSIGPAFDAVTPDNNMYCQGNAPLQAIITDPAGGRAVKWEYRPKGSTGAYTTIGTVTKTAPFIGTDSFALLWNTTGLATGEYEVKLTASDGSGSANTSTTSRTYKVDNQGPTIVSEVPTSNSVVSGYTQALSATATDWSKVGEVWWEYWDGSEWVLIDRDSLPNTGNDSTGTFSGIWHTTNVKDGTYSVRVKAKDKSPAKVENAGYTISYKVDNLKPRIEQILPKERSFIKGTATLQAKVPAAYDGNGIAHVKWYYSANQGTTWQLVGTATTATSDVFSINWDTSLVPQQAVAMKIVATNSLGSSSEANFRYTIDNESPQLVSAAASSRNLVTLLFNETNINSASATNPSNYSIYPVGQPELALTISGIEAKTDGTGIKLTTGNQTEGVNYTAAIIGDVYDNAGNPLVGSTTVSFVGNGQAKGNPHGDYVSNTAWCATCHSTHAGQAEKLLSRAKEKLVCYICHDDSGLSYFDVKKEFGAIEAEGAATSHHPVPEDEQKCITCHDPHASWGSSNPMLLKVKDGKGNLYRQGNEVCFACHGSVTSHGATVEPIVGLPKVDDKESYYVETAGLDGGPMGVHADRDPVAFPSLVAPTYAKINCDVCHEPHGSENPKLLRLEVNDRVVHGNSDEFCLGCHTDETSVGTSFLGKEVWENTTYSAHSRRDSGALYPGGEYGRERTAEPYASEDRGKCINCHNVHGTEYGCGLVDRYTIPDHNDTDAYANYAICFKCHGPDGVSKNVTTKNMVAYYQNTYAGEITYGGNQGHFIKSANRYKDKDGHYLAVGWKIPCTDCHNTHGSTGENRFLLKGDINGDNFTHLFKGTAKSGRQFCLQCHRAYDDARGPAPYRGATIPLMPDTNPEHAQAGTIECNYCHGGGDLIKGAHAPNSGRSEGGLDCNLCHLTMSGEMGIGSSRSRHQMSHFEADQPLNKYDASSLGVLQSKTCLSTCHTDHDVFNEDPVGQKRYLRARGGDVSGTPAGITNNYQVSVDSHLSGRTVPTVNSLCMSSACHGTTNNGGRLNDSTYLSPGKNSETSDLRTQILCDSNGDGAVDGSTHAIASDPKNPYVDADTLTPEFFAIWNSRSPKRLLCTDCHVDATTGANFDLKREGPHSSDNVYMLKATGIKIGSVQTYDSLCTLCHQAAVYGGNGVQGSGVGSKTATTHTRAGHYQTGRNPSGCLGCHCGNREGFGAPGATRGSVHGSTSRPSGFLNGNYISDANISGRSCTMATSDPGAMRCNSAHYSKTY